MSENALRSTSFRESLEAELNACVDHWLKRTIERASDELKDCGLDTAELDEMLRRRREWHTRQADAVRAHLPRLADDDRDLPHTAEELEALAEELSPGGVHDGGFLARIIYKNVWWVRGPLLAAMIRANWHGGKVGFQFLPDPAVTDRDEYEEAAANLVELVRDGVDGDPQRVLTGENLAFFESLPERFTIYRGAAGISPELAGAGVCWTTRRDVAEWFAWRSAGFARTEPVLVSARVNKQDVCFVKASEFEVVTQRRRVRALKCRRHRNDWRPEMEWAPSSEP